jgi:hypothetical protein
MIAWSVPGRSAFAPKALRRDNSSRVIEREVDAGVVRSLQFVVCGVSGLPGTP